MIRKTITHTKKCTFIVHTPVKNFPHPTGTGFFISKEGYFITANHVIDKVEDFSKVRFSQPEGAQILSVSLINKWINHDIALLKADFDANKKRKIDAEVIMIAFFIVYLHGIDSFHLHNFQRFIDYNFTFFIYINRAIFFYKSSTYIIFVKNFSK